MKGLPRFLFLPDIFAGENRQYLICTNKPACIAEIFEYSSIEEIEKDQANPPDNWFIKLNGKDTVIAGRTKYDINGVYYVIVIRKFFEEPTARDIPIEGNITGGVISRMLDWFYAHKKKLHT
jgi:hypothetical protein